MLALRKSPRRSASSRNISTLAQSALRADTAAAAAGRHKAATSGRLRQAQSEAANV
jgi:hypothetical protein